MVELGEGVWDVWFYWVNEVLVKYIINPSYNLVAIHVS